MSMEPVSVQWFPGHMSKTRRMIRDLLRLVDMAVELRDARIPNSSANPEIEKLLDGKKRVLLLNKSDMADPRVTGLWLKRYETLAIPAIAVDCRSGKGLNAFLPLARATMAEELERWKSKGMKGRSLRIMVVGVPNAGKSSFINRLASSRRAAVEDRPGVTRGRQWVKLDGGIELLDMPGVLWPRFEDKLTGEHLAFTGAIRDQVTDSEALAARLLERLAADYPAQLAARYKLERGAFADMKGYELLLMIGKKRGMLLPNGEINAERASIMLLDEFRGGKIGRITLENP